MKIIGLSGKSGSGKTYIANNYFKPLGYHPCSLSDHFKIWMVGRKICTYEEAFNTKPAHIRDLLFLEGTVRGRDVYGSNIWLDTIMAWLTLYEERWGTDKFIISDIRFKNELDCIQNIGGRVFRIIAPHRIKQSSLTDKQRITEAEIDLDSVSLSKFDGIIMNDLSTSDRYLRHQIETLLREP